MYNQQVTKQFLRALSHLEYGAMNVTTPDGKIHNFYGDNAGASANLILHDWRVIGSFVQKGDIGLAEAYRDGWWDSDNLADLFLVGLQNEVILDQYVYGSIFGRLAQRMAYWFTRNTIKGSQKNIHAHYDLGNDFYKLWLDPTMTYSAAIFKDRNEDLLAAQHNKYDRILERLSDTGNVLEIGCGWGGFMQRALEQKDYDIKGLTISEAQHAYAAKRLQNKATVALEDYRTQNGKYDHIVSIEMFEAVGEKFWPVYFSKIKALLADKGKAVIQTITIKDEYFKRYQAGGDAIRTFIFPGGMLPSAERFAVESIKAGLRMTDRFAFGQDYATTLEHWLAQFEARLSQVKALNFDEKFIRMWRFYLTSCIASFKNGRTSVMQVELQHAA